MKAFISYPHKDSEALDRLHVHLASLRRDGKIDAWFDREILAGDELDKEIAAQLESCELFLLLVSPDFLASDYCVEKEMTRALQRHEAGQARVVPIIVEPCDWTSSPLRKLKAVPLDGKPISEWTNRNTAFLNVIQEIRRIVDQGFGSAVPEPRAASNTPTAGRTATERRYRIQREFDEIDRSDFRDAAFRIIKDYFGNAVRELDTVEGLRGRFADYGDTSFGCVVVNSGLGRGTAHLTVHCGRGRHSFSDIYYSFEEKAAENTANGGFSIEADEYELFLRPMMNFTRDDGRLTAESAAERLWGELLQQAGIAYD